MELPECWYSADAEEELRLTKELLLELIPTHALHGLNIKVVAHRDGANDDILCKHTDKEDLFTVVHLTWSMKPEVDARYPTIDFHGTYTEFLKWEELQY